jgi:DNA-binding response OmpR family regulator
MLVRMAKSANSTSSNGASSLIRQQPVITAILDRLDAADDSKFRNRRGTPRYSLRRIDVPVRIYHPGGTVAFKMVATRNLSATGIGLLYTGFLHIGTKIEIALERRAGGHDLIRGTVVFCVHVAGSFHHLGVHLDQKISPRIYVDRASFEKMDAGAVPTTLAGTLLHLDDSEVERKLLAHYLKTTKISLTSLPGGQAGIDAVTQNQYDLALCEANFKSVTGERLIGQLREAGYAGRILVVTSETLPDRLRALKQAGAIGMLGKPYDQAKLFALIGAFLKRVPADSGVVSSLAKDPEMRSLIDRYVANVHQLATDIEKAVTENQIDRMRQICNSLKGTGASYGFAALSESAKEAMRTLDATMSIQESEAQIRQLLKLCKRVIVG